MSDSLTIIDTQFSDTQGNALMRRQDASLTPVQSIEEALAFRNMIIEFTRKIMVKDKDYGTIPGTQKDTLYKAGAEKLCQHFGLSDSFDIIEKIEDWTGAEHGGEPLFLFAVRCKLSRNGLPVTEGVGSCNSWETKYRTRSVYPNQATEEDKKRGKLVTKPGKQKTTYQVYIVPNDNVFDLINTLLKMAKKRALTDAVLRATSASEFYTQDVEDMPTASHAEAVQETGATPEPPRDLLAEFKAKKATFGGGSLADFPLVRRLLGYAPGQELLDTDFALCLDECDEEKWRVAVAAIQLQKEQSAKLDTICQELGYTGDKVLLMNAVLGKEEGKPTPEERANALSMALPIWEGARDGLIQQQSADNKRTVDAMIGANK